MAVRRKGLGRGLNAIFGDDADTKESGAKKKTTAKAGSKATAKTAAGSDDKESAKGSAKEPAKESARAAAKKKTRKEAPVNTVTEEGAVKEQEAAAAGQKAVNEEKPGGEVLVKISRILANEAQPRKNFGEEPLKELTESVRQYGVLQPLLVKKDGDNYRIIAGERRFRAAKAAGLTEIPVIVRDYTTQQAAEISIIENVQREDLNPIEEAMAYQMLIDDYGLTQEEIAERVSRNRTTVTNAIRLLKLSDEVKAMVAEGTLSQGHARTLLGIEDPEKQLELAKQVIVKSLSVRDTERLVKLAGRKPHRKPAEDETEGNDVSLFFRDYEDKMRTILGTKVHISRRDRNKGRIEIDYYSTAELERIMELFRNIGRE